MRNQQTPKDSAIRARFQYTALIFLISLSLFPSIEAQETQPARSTVAGVVSQEIPGSRPPEKRNGVWGYLPDFIADAFASRPGPSEGHHALGPGNAELELSVLLDGETGYIRIPHSPTLGFPQDFTVETWIKPSHLDKQMGIYEKSEPGNSSFSLQVLPGGVLQLSMSRQGREITSGTIRGTTALSAGEWSHVAFVYDGTSVRLFLNGKVEGQADVKADVFTNVGDVTLGLVQAGKRKHFFRGQMDEIRISNFARYSAEFIPEGRLYGGGILGFIAGSWRFTNQAARDESGNENHGTPIGGFAFVAESPAGSINPTSDNQFSPQGFINFNDVAPYTLLHNAYPDISFREYQYDGFPMRAYWDCDSQGNACNGQTGNYAAADDPSVPVQFTFANPATALSFKILAFDLSGGSFAGWVSLRQAGQFYAFRLYSNGRNVPYTFSTSQFTCGGVPCNRVTQVVVWGIEDPLGLVYEDFSYTLLGEPTPTPEQCRPENSTDDSRPPCQPTPTPTPSSDAPNAPNNLQAVRKEGEVELTWDWGSSASHPNMAQGFQVYRSNSQNGPFTPVGPTIPITTTRVGSDISPDLEIDIDKFYQVKAYIGSVNSAPSNIVASSPISPCDGLPRGTSAPATAPIGDYNWTGLVVNPASGFLEVRDVRLKGRLMARRLSLASFAVKTGLNPDAGSFVQFSSYQQLDTVTRELFKENNGEGEGVRSRASYCFSAKNGQHHWVVTVRFEFFKRELPVTPYLPLLDPRSKCEPFGDVPCSRFRPSISYTYHSPKKFERLDHHVLVYQRLHYRENDDLTNTVELYRDCDFPDVVSLPNRPNSCIPLTYPVQKKIPIQSEAQAPFAPLFHLNGRKLYDTRSPAVTGEIWDNVHQTGADSVAGPSPIPQGRPAGCMSCVHDHWRWPQNEVNFIAPLISVPMGTFVPIDKLEFRPGQYLIGDDFYNRVKPPFKMPKQTGHMTFVNYRVSEEALIDISPIQNEEVIYQPARIENNIYTPPGGDYVSWYIAKSFETPVERNGVFQSGDTIHAHKGFFAERLNTGDHNTPVSAPTGTSGTTFFRPLSVTTQNVYKVGTISSTYGHGRSVPPLPSGYVRAGQGGTELPVLINYSRGPSDPGLLASGRQDVVFHITDQNLSMSDLRVLYLAWDEKKKANGWADITHENNPANRTMIGRFEYFSPGGFLEENVRLFLIVRKPPSAISSDPTADMTISGTVSPDPVRSGNNLTYNWTVTNNGPDSATNASFLQYISAQTTLVSATSSVGECHDHDNLHGGGEDGAVRCSLGTLANGATASVSVVVKVTEFGDASKTGGDNLQVESTAHTGSSVFDNDSSNNARPLFATAQPSLNKPPSAAITSPLPNTVFVSPSSNPTSISVSVNAGDIDGSISKVELLDNGNLAGTVTTQASGVYTFNINAPTYGLHNLVAVAEDNGGRFATSASISIIVNSSSTLTIVSPTGSGLLVPGAPVVVETRSNVPGGRLQKVELSLNGAPVGKLRSASNTGNIYTHRITLPQIPRGKHILKAVLTEFSGATTTTPDLEVIANTLPSIGLTSPANGTTFPSATDIPITASVSHPDGHVAKLEFFASGTLIGTDVNLIASGTRTFSWKKPADGIYSIQVVATDDLGSVITSSPVNIGVNRPSPAVGELIWVDDHLPTGSTAGGDDGWNWMAINPDSLSGRVAHQSLLKAGPHEHYFEGASHQLQVSADEKLSAWVFLDPDFPPAEIMLQWKDDQGWDHRAYWGQNLINEGVDGTSSRKRIGDIPTGTGWKQLKVPASDVGLVGKLVNGMKFTVHGGRAAWDRVGKILANAPGPGPDPDFVWMDDNPPAGAILEAYYDTWTDGTWITNPVHSGVRAHRHWENGDDQRYRQHSFRNASTTMTVKPGDTLFVWVYIYPDFQYRPDALILQWFEPGTGWEHRAYWGRDARDWDEVKGVIPVAAPGTRLWRHMGNVPGSGWTMLEIPASYVGLEGKTVSGMSFGVFQNNKRGRAVWDEAGKTSAAPNPSLGIPPLKFTTPLWRTKCGSGSGERLWYSPSKDYHYFTEGCQPGVNTGFIYSYPAPGTIPLHALEDENHRWYLSPTPTLHPGLTPRWIVGHMPWEPVPQTPTVPDSSRMKQYRCNQNWHFTTAPDPPDAVVPSCTQEAQPFIWVHKR